VRIEKQSCYGITPRNAEQSFALRALMDDTVKLVTITGTAGTGKTLLAGRRARVPAALPADHARQASGAPLQP
jgi:predicted ribonuclease YlaK